MFPYLNRTELTLFSIEIEKGLKLGYKYEFLDGYHFNRALVLKDMMTEGFKNKAEAKEQGCAALAKTYKILINSGYGFWAIRTENKRQVKMLDINELNQEIQAGKVYSYNHVGED